MASIASSRDRFIIQVIVPLPREHPVRIPYVDWLEGKNPQALNNPAFDEFLRVHGDKRYRFLKDKSRLLSRKIFEVAFEKNQNGIIRAAEQIKGKSFYPLWKRVVWIDLPYTIHRVFENPLLKIAFTVGSLYGFVKYSYHIYENEALRNFIPGKLIPFFINHTPLVLVQLFNKASSAVQWVFANPFIFLAYLVVGRQVVLWGPQILYLTSAARAVSISALFWTIWGGPQTIGGFLINASIGSIGSIWNTCEEISYFFNDIADKSRSEQIALSKQAAYEIWQEIVEHRIRQAPLAPRLDNKEEKR